MSKLKMPEKNIISQEAKIAEVKLLNETITSKLEE